MAFRTVVITGHVKLEFRLGYLIVRGETERRVHLSEISTLIVETTSAALTTALLAELVKNKTSVIFCDEKHLPLSHIEAYSANFASSKRVREQAFWDETRKSTAWGKIVRHKIRMQAEVLRKHGHDAAASMLDGYRQEVTDGDCSNREGHAAKVYFNALFGMDFSRRNENIYNSRLNYGYAVILSAVSREIAAAGYITQLGIWHGNEFNNFNFASDLMEPFRPIADDFSLGLSSDLDKNFKTYMPKVMLTKVRLSGHEQYLDTAIRLFVRDVIRFMDGEVNDISEFSEWELPKCEL
ncbi:MAG: type II CRISPR-associated endonuclease Cas1 [Clostridiales bacterium]|jgi:CRISPR-associated endonuclease Cas1 subtype II|nr:type II CRISPR-associated endonuclease Cas1 [Clostridiales bacterium]